MNNKKSQGWGMDLIVGSVIFLIGIIIFYIYALNSSEESRGIIENLFYDGKVIAGSILSDGYPENWDSGNVIKIGILTDHKINNTKLERFYNLVQADYNKTKNMFSTKYDYYFLFDENMTITGNSIDGIGKPGVDRNNLNSQNLIKITRFVIYNEKPVTAYIYIWD